MMLKSEKTEAVELDDKVFENLLGFYPEEKLIEHKVFQDTFASNSITIKSLRDISEKIHLPWQMFLLNIDNLKRELENIEKHRLDKFPQKISGIDKRKGRGDITSKRIIDRQIRIQAFVSRQLPDEAVCDFSSSLKGKNVQEAVTYITEYFKIDIGHFRSRDSAEESLEYLIKQIQVKNNINISQGVGVNGILPEIKNTRKLYKNTSGFVVKDKKMPFIFLPSEINPEENHFRQIYTLLYLLTVVGLDSYQFAIEKYSIKKIREDKMFRKIHKIVSELLLPESETSQITASELNKDLVNKLKEKFKISYTAILFTLRSRKVVDKNLFESLELPEKEPTTLQRVHDFFNRPLINTSVRKFCGGVASGIINNAIKNNTLYPNQAQMVIFGRPRKDKWIEYRSRV